MHQKCNVPPRSRAPRAAWRAVLALCLAPTASSFYVQLSAHGVSNLHAAANRATKARKHDEALALLQTAVRHSGDGRSYLLLSLHHQRMGSRDGARSALRAGLVARGVHRAERDDPGAQRADEVELLQAWALLESKAGDMPRAVLLLRRASQLDRRRVRAVLSWAIFREHIRQHNPLARPVRSTARAGRIAA